MSTYVPYVIERSARGERTYDIFSRLLMDRIVFLGTGISGEVANSIIAQMLFLEAENNKEPIKLYINSPGGSVSDGLAIYDTMQMIKSPIHTICVGMAASMGAFLLAAGDRGRRFALRHSRVMIHQPWTTQIEGSASDVKIEYEELLTLKELLAGEFAANTGRPIEEVHRDQDRDRWMSAQQARDYGIIDTVFRRVGEPGAPETV
jgi:ATP-dependent Clp protease protease subunit